MDTTSVEILEEKRRSLGALQLMLTPSLISAIFQVVVSELIVIAMVRMLTKCVHTLASLNTTLVSLNSTESKSAVLKQTEIKALLLTKFLVCFPSQRQLISRDLPYM